MAKTFAKVHGLDELKINIKNVNSALADGEQEMVVVEAEALAAEIRGRAPVRTGFTRDEVQVVKNVDTGRGSKKAAGVSMGRAFQWKFLEFGTEKMKAQPFIRPAIEARKSGMMERIKKRLWRSIEGAL